jgi:hypothetical protein
MLRRFFFATRGLFDHHLFSLPLQNEGQFTFQEEWSHDSQPAGMLALERDPLPPPVAADLNGDGRSEVVIVTHDSKLMVRNAQSLCLILALCRHLLRNCTLAEYSY